MTNYERIKNLSVSDIARFNIERHNTVNDGYYIEYHTSDGSVFLTYNDAFEYEVSWLNKSEDVTVWTDLD